MKRFLLSIFLMLIVGATMAQNISGVKSIPAEKYDLAQGLKTGYYLLKQVNGRDSAAEGEGVGWIKAAREAVNESVTSKNTGTPSANDATYLWYVEVTNTENNLITIATANKAAALSEELWEGQKRLVAYDNRISLKYHLGEVSLGGSTATPDEGSCLISNEDVTAFVHFSGDNYGSWHDANINSMFMVEFYEVSIDELNIEYPHNTQNMNRNPVADWNRRGLASFTLIDDNSNSLNVTDIQTLISDPVYVNKSEQKLITTAGSRLHFSEFNWVGNAMHAYAYIDYNKDYHFDTTINNDGTNEGEVVSYNYYQGTDITGATIEDRAQVNFKTYGDSKGMPAFTLPANLAPGEYRMRIKIDWDNLDGDYGTSSIANDGGCQCDITIVITEPYTLNVTDAGWATLYLDFPAAIPAFEGDEAGAYIITGVKEGGKLLNLVKIEGTLPANEGIIVKANAGEYVFEYSTATAANTEGNLLDGTVSDDIILKEDSKEYYVLAADGEVGVGFYTAGNGGDNTAFKNWANKAYLVLPKTQVQGAANFSLRYEGTTSIEEVETENAVKAIYDLTGRKVNEITAPGIYIVGGKKVLVK